jgi:hypothetical protein
MLKINIISIFPEYLKPLELSLLGKAQEKGLISIEIHDLRKQTTDPHHSVDDTPYGGGAGMVMSAEPWGLAIDEVSKSEEEFDLIVLTPAGKNFSTFDKNFIDPLLSDISRSGEIIKFRSRVLDPAILYVDWVNDDSLPSLSTCKERAGLDPLVTHDALDDAWDVIELLRKNY